MRRATLALAALVLLAALFLLTVGLASESGEEIVVLTTTAEDGAPAETRLWVVDDAGHAWLRAGVPTSGWLVRLEAHPEVTVLRGGESLRLRAVPVREPATRDRIHALMREKYGFADRWISLIRDGTESVAVRLDPIPPG